MFGCLTFTRILIYLKYNLALYTTRGSQSVLNFRCQSSWPRRALTVSSRSSWNPSPPFHNWARNDAWNPRCPGCLRSALPVSPHLKSVTLSPLLATTCVCVCVCVFFSLDVRKQINNNNNSNKTCTSAVLQSWLTYILPYLDRGNEQSSLHLPKVSKTSCMEKTKWLVFLYQGCN